MENVDLNEILRSQNRDLNTIDVPITRIKVRALVKCGDEYIFIGRTRPGKRQHYTVFPGGRVKKTDRPPTADKFGSEYLDETIRRALVRELQEELACQLIKIGQLLSISKVKEHDQEVLYFVEAASFNWAEKTGKEFQNPNKGTFELIRLKKIELTKEKLGKKGLRLKPKNWLKLLVTIFGAQD